MGYPGSVLRVGVQGPGSLLPTLPGYTARYTTPASQCHACQRCGAVVRKDSLGSGLLPSLGNLPWEDYPAQSRHGSSRVLHGCGRTRKSGNGQCLDRHRAMWPLINLEENNDGESPTPGFFRMFARARPRMTTFINFARLAHRLPANSPIPARVSKSDKNGAKVSKRGHSAVFCAKWRFPRRLMGLSHPDYTFIPGIKVSDALIRQA